MASLADVLRQAGYVTPQGVTGPNAPLAQQLKNYATNVIPTARQNLAQQRADIDAALTMGQGGVQIADREAFERQMAQVPNLMGATIPIYHSTTREAAENIGKRGFDQKKSYDTTAWFTTSPNPMETGASGQGAVIKRFIDEDKLKLATMEDVDKYFIDQLISQGYQGVKYPQRGQKGDETYYQMFYPNKLKKERLPRKQIIEQELKKVVE
jgi:hypothetical protein